MKQSGIALIQVLLITAIISILALYFTQTARQQVHIAELTNDRAKAWLALKSAQSQLFLSLLTQHREPNLNAENNVVKAWNFYNRPFAINQDVEAQIQDQSGLVSIHFPDAKLVFDIFKENEIDTGLAPILVDGLLDWQDADKLSRLNGIEDYFIGPRNGNISLYQELFLVNGMAPQIQNQLGDIFTLYQRGPFNPLTAPDQVVRGVLGNDRASEYIELRKNSAITLENFTNATGMQESIDQIFYPGDVLSIRLQSTKGGITLSKTLMVELKPYAKGEQSPVDYLEVKW